MTIRLLLICLLVGSTVHCHGQSCGTVGPDSVHVQGLPWYNNAAFLEAYMDSTEKANQHCKSNGLLGNGGQTSAAVRIPVQFVLANDNLGNRPMEPWELEELVRMANEFHSNSGTGIQFYGRCEIVEINSDALNTGTTFANRSNLYGMVDSEDAIDIFVIESTVDSWAGAADFPNDDFPYHAVITGTRVGRTLEEIAITMTHEIGHCLNLMHTHQPGQGTKTFNHECNRCKQESVSRTKGNGLLCSNTGSLKCALNGDILCDTEADPLMNFLQNFDVGTCTYNGAGATGNIPDEDNWGDQWTPDVRNLMSYGARCRNVLSPMQGAVQQVTATNGIPDVYPSLRNDFDVFEPDNFVETARPILPGEVQCHTFHYSGGTEEIPVACDEDWVSFSNPVFGSVNIKTWGVLYRPEPDTEIRLFDDSMNLLTSNDNFGNGTFSWIQGFNLLPGNYFVQVLNNSFSPGSQALGHYNLRVLLDSPVTSEKPEDLSRFIKVSPNPCRNTLTINLQEVVGNVNIELLNSTGTVVDRWYLRNATTKAIQLGDLPRGMYCMLFSTAYGKTVKRLLLQ